MVQKQKNGKKFEVTPSQNFVQTAGYRVDAILDQLDRLGKQHGKSYEYTEAQLEKISETILAKLAETIENLKKPSKAKKAAGFAAILGKC